LDYFTSFQKALRSFYWKALGLKGGLGGKEFFGGPYKFGKETYLRFQEGNSFKQLGFNPI